MTNVKCQIKDKFWSGKRVLITGHTGFKGSWLCLWLTMLGADVTGYALNPPTNPSLFELCEIDDLINSNIADIRDVKTLQKVIAKCKPEIVFHMAAQPLVRESYKKPIDTYEINVQGTINLLESIRSCKSVRAIINITTDKVYENDGRKKGYVETDPLGGFDPYSSSKACSEIVTAAYRNSFLKGNGVAVATARAGNVIGGGDWADDRLIPDFVRAILKNKKLEIRNPKAVRPWQHVLEPLSGYLLLAQRLYEKGSKYSEAWNFGPDEADAKPVEWIAKKICSKWGNDASYAIDKRKHPHEANYLKLDCTKAKSRLNWKPKWNLEMALDKIVEWTKAYKNKQDMREICLSQIMEYINAK